MKSEEEIKQLREEYVKHAQELNAMSDEEIDKLVDSDNCPYRPELLVGIPLGMFHCPICGDMVVAALKHGRRGTELTDAEFEALEAADQAKDEARDKEIAAENEHLGSTATS